MKTLKGAGGIHVPAMQQESRKLTVEFEAQDAAVKALQRFKHDGVEPPKVKQDAKAPVAQKEAASGRSPVDWARFDALRKATPAQLDAAIARYRALDRLDLDFQKLVTGLNYLGDGIEVEKLPDADARRHYHDRRELLMLIDVVRRGLAAAGDSPAVAGFPREQLAALEENLKADLALLLQVKGKGVEAPPPVQRYGGGGYGYNASGEPSLDALPATTAVLSVHVATVEDAARILGERLQVKGLEKGLLEAARRVPADKQQDLARLLGAYAILADEAVHAPDYAKNPFSHGPSHRQAYRARQMDKYGAAGDALRRQISRASLYTPLVDVQGAADPLRALEKALVKETLREIGVPEDAGRHWAASAAAIAAALEGEAFLPLRALNERAPHHVAKMYAPEMTDVVRTLTRAVIEGRFEEWRATNDASREQLSILDEAQRKAWLAPISIEHEVEGKNGPVALKTTEPRGFEMFWATKVGGASHAFDTMTQCFVSLLTNARNNTITVQDPRWQNDAGRTYIRLVQRAQTGEPVVLLESSHTDVIYPGGKLDLEKAILKHAIAKARAMKVKLVCSGRLDYPINQLGLPGDWRQEQYRLAPALFIEAASIFGSHDWIQKQPEVRGCSSTQFYVDLDKAPK